jgi:hypothetical protein
MKKEERLYSTLTEVRAPEGLCERILVRIELAKRRGAQLRAGLFGLLVVLTAGALVPVLEYTSQQFYASGFYDYLMLALSDHTLVTTYWREFGLTLLESLPSLALLLLIPTIAALLWSLRRLVKNARSGFIYA